MIPVLFSLQMAEQELLHVKLPITDWTTEHFPMLMLQHMHVVAGLPLEGSITKITGKPFAEVHIFDMNANGFKHFLTNVAFF